MNIDIELRTCDGNIPSSLTLSDIFGTLVSLTDNRVLRGLVTNNFEEDVPAKRLVRILFPE
jgi:hypothetical protein